MEVSMNEGARISGRFHMDLGVAHFRKPPWLQRGGGFDQQNDDVADCYMILPIKLGTFKQYIHHDQKRS